MDFTSLRHTAEFFVNTKFLISGSYFKRLKILGAKLSGRTKLPILIRRIKTGWSLVFDELNLIFFKVIPRLT